MNCILYVPAVLFFSDLSVVSTPTKCLKGVYLFESWLCDVHKKFQQNCCSDKLFGTIGEIAKWKIKVRK